MHQWEKTGAGNQQFKIIPVLEENSTSTPDLSGTYYRVRIGYFKGLSVARAFGENNLVPLGYSFWAEDSYTVNRVVAGYGIMGRLIATYYFITWRLAGIELFQSLYRRVRRKVRIFRDKG